MRVCGILLRRYILTDVIIVIILICSMQSCYSNKNNEDENREPGSASTQSSTELTAKDSDTERDSKIKEKDTKKEKEFENNFNNQNSNPFEDDKVEDSYGVGYDIYGEPLDDVYSGFDDDYYTELFGKTKNNTHLKMFPPETMSDEEAIRKGFSTFLPNTGDTNNDIQREIQILTMLFTMKSAKEREDYLREIGRDNIDEYNQLIEELLLQTIKEEKDMLSPDWIGEVDNLNLDDYGFFNYDENENMLLMNQDQEVDSYGENYNKNAKGNSVSDDRIDDEEDERKDDKDVFDKNIS